MDSSIISIKATFELDNSAGPSVRIEDITDYASVGINPLDIKGNIRASYGSTVFHNGISWSTPDIDPNTSYSKTFLLPVDTNGKVINASYVFLYTVQVTGDVVYSIGTNFTPPGGATFSSIQLASVTTPVVNAINALLTNPDYSAVKVRFLDSGGATLGNTTNMLGCSVGGLITFASITLASFASIDTIVFTATSLNENSFSYSFCNKPIEPNLCVTSSCYLAQVYVKDESVYPAYLTSSARTMIIQFPRKADGTPVDTAITTSAATYTVGPIIWSGNYTISLSTAYTYTQDDGLFVEDTLIAFSEHNVRCDNGLCELSGCISMLRWKYVEALKAGSKDAFELREQNFQVGLLCNEYIIASTCKNFDKAQASLKELSALLEQSGCNCGCNTQDQGEPTIINPSIVF